MLLPANTDVLAERSDRSFLPSSCLAIVTTLDADGQVSAARCSACTPNGHDSVYTTFTAGKGHPGHGNVLATGESVVNLPAAPQVRGESANG